MGNWMTRFRTLAAIVASAALAIGTPAAGQEVESIDPNNGIDWDIANPEQAAANEASEAASSQPMDGPGAPIPGHAQVEYGPATAPAEGAASPRPSVSAWTIDGDLAQPAVEAAPSGVADVPPAAEVADAEGAIPENLGETYDRGTLVGAAEGVFGDGAEGLAKLIEDVLRDQGEPNGYITGREGGGAVVVGLRYGSGTLHHKVEGQRPVYWTGPSLGFDAGANVGRTFVLVYNLFDTEDLYKRFPAGEGQAYLVGGVQAGYVRSGDIVLIPIRMGAGVRLGVNAGYMKFTKNRNWLPF